jgi:hypothetical protein
MHHVKQSLTIPRGIIYDHLIGPYLLPLRLTGDIYLTFLQETLPELLEVVPLEARYEMWFQHDVVCEYLVQTFGNRWIGRGGPITWPPHSLTQLHWIFLWGYMQSLMYKTAVGIQHDLVATIAAAAGTIQEMLGIFQKSSV